MRFGHAAGWAAVLMAVIGPAATSASAAPAADTTRVDVSSAGVLASAAPDPSDTAMSANANLVVFVSSASNLVAGDTNGMRDVFVRNVRSGVTTRADLGAGGVQANGDSFGPVAISGDGRFVAFESDSSNLAAASGCSPGNLPFCLFIRDRTAGTTRVVKRIPNPAIVALSEHGRYLVAQGDAGQLLRIDLHTGSVVRVSCCGLGDDLKNLSFGGMSANANLITFGLNAGPSGGNPGLLQVFVRNIARGTTTLISRAPDGTPGNGDSFAGGISPGGRYVIYTSSSTNLVGGDTNRRSDVFVRDRRRGTTRRVDPGLNGGQANGDGHAIGISAGGRYRVFTSTASNLVPGDTNRAWDVFVRDRHTGRTVRVDLTATGGQANRGIGRGAPDGVAMTPGARWIAFISPSTNLVAAGANRLAHAFLRGPLH